MAIMMTYDKTIKLNNIFRTINIDCYFSQVQTAPKPTNDFQSGYITSYRDAFLLFNLPSFT